MGDELDSLIDDAFDSLSGDTFHSLSLRDYVFKYFNLVMLFIAYLCGFMPLRV